MKPSSPAARAGRGNAAGINKAAKAAAKMNRVVRARMVVAPPVAMVSGHFYRLAGPKVSFASRDGRKWSANGAAVERILKPLRNMARRADRAALREEMVARQLAARGIRDGRVLEAMRCVPREEFVPAELVEFAYEDSPLPISEQQTISQPYIVALMPEALELQPQDRVLEVGTGSGYAAAVLAHLAADVSTIERHESLALSARRKLVELGYTNVDVIHGDGSLGWPAG